MEEEGGVEHITRERKWPQIACKLGLPTHKGQGSVIRTHYERLLNPFCLFQHGKSVPNEVGIVDAFCVLMFCDSVSVSGAHLLVILFVVSGFTCCNVHRC